MFLYSMFLYSNLAMKLGKIQATGHNVPVAQDNLAERCWRRQIYRRRLSFGTELVAQENERGNYLFKKAIFLFTEIELISQTGLLHTKRKPKYVTPPPRITLVLHFTEVECRSHPPRAQLCHLPFPLCPSHSLCSNAPGLWAVPGTS